MTYTLKVSYRDNLRKRNAIFCKLCLLSHIRSAHVKFAENITWFSYVAGFKMFRIRSASSLSDEKLVARAFIKFLEEKKLKQDMLESQLKNIYDSQFPLHYSTGVKFARVLNALKYHLNLCQQLQDRVIFGGGEAAALKMLSLDDPDESSSEEEDEFSRLVRLATQTRCKICKRSFRGHAAYQSHLNTVSHRQQGILKKIRQSVEK